MSEHFVVDEGRHRLWIADHSARSLRFDHGVQAVAVKYVATCARVMPLGDADELPGRRLQVPSAAHTYRELTPSANRHLLRKDQYSDTGKGNVVVGLHSRWKAFTPILLRLSTAWTNEE